MTEHKCRTCGTTLLKITKSGLYTFYNVADITPDWYCPKCKIRYGKKYVDKDSE